MGEIKNFGWALEILKKGGMVFRKNWNGVTAGEIMYLKLQVPDHHSKMNTPYIYLSAGPNGGPLSLVPWLASQVDVLSDDWSELLTGKA